MTLIVRDEEDILEAQLAFHLNAGVDFVIATDHDSRDGTTEILESYARAGYLRLLRESGDVLRQAEWTTRMARLAAAEHGADWVILSDADEFWWPRGGTLKGLLAAVPSRYGLIHAPQLYFLPRLDGGEFFAERMTVALTAHAPINDPLNTFRPVSKIAHRGDPAVVVGQGNHALVGSPLVRLPGWSPIQVLHFPQRSLSQFEHKTRTVMRAFGERHRGDFARAQDALKAGRFGGRYATSVVDDDRLERGLETGSLIVDTRLRDALRALRRPVDSARTFALPQELDRPLDFGRARVEDQVAEAAQAETLREADTVRLQRRLDELETRIVGISP
jgi:Glycosyl transferase family 2